MGLQDSIGAIRKTVNTDALITPNNHLAWVYDYKTYGEDSYVFNDKKKLYELYSDPYISLNDKAIAQEAIDFHIANHSLPEMLHGLYGVEDGTPWDYGMQFTMSQIKAFLSTALSDAQKEQILTALDVIIESNGPIEDTVMLVKVIVNGRRYTIVQLNEWETGEYYGCASGYSYDLPNGETVTRASHNELHSNSELELSYPTYIYPKVICSHITNAQGTATGCYNGYYETYNYYEPYRMRADSVFYYVPITGGEE